MTGLWNPYDRFSVQSSWAEAKWQQIGAAKNTATLRPCLSVLLPLSVIFSVFLCVSLSLYLSFQTHIVLPLLLLTGMHDEQTQWSSEWLWNVFIKLHLNLGLTNAKSWTLSTTLYFCSQKQNCLHTPVQNLITHTYFLMIFRQIIIKVCFELLQYLCCFFFFYDYGLT